MSTLSISLYPVVVHNNDKTTYEQAFNAVSTVFSLGTERANAVVHEIDKEKSCIIGRFSKEIAESYVDEMERFCTAFKFELPAEIMYTEIEFLEEDDEDEDLDDI